MLADNLLMVAAGNPLDKDIILKVDKAYNRALARNLCRLRCLRGLRMVRTLACKEPGL